MPNIIDKVNINGTSYDIKDSISPASTITSSDIINWNDKINNEYIGYLENGTLYVPKNWFYSQSASSYSYYLFFYVKNGTTINSNTTVKEIGTNVTKGRFELIYVDGQLKTGNVSLSVNRLYAYKYSDGANYIYTVANLSDIPTIPSNVSAFTNDAGYISAETDPTVPSWAKASQKPTYTASEVGAVAISTVGMPSGVAPLNASSKIDESYLPSYVDDVIEGYYYNNKFWKESTHTTEITGEAGKIYVDLSTDKTYRFGGTAFVEISSGTTVSVVRDLTSGTKVGTITVNGTGTDLYAPTPPSKVSELSNDSGFISGISAADVSTALGYTPYNSTNPNGYVNAAGASAAAPVQSVNSKTGAVTLSAADVGALPSNTTIPTVTNTYSSSGTDAVSGTAVYSALQTLDSSIAATANSAISAITITDGKITASSKIAIPTVPSNVSAFSNDAGYITGIDSSDVTTALGYTPISAETDPIFSASAAASISAADITSWNNKVSDDHKWNDVTLDKSYFNDDSDYSVPVLLSNSAISAKLLKINQAEIARSIPRRDVNGYLYTTTPSSDDNSTKVATTAFVKTVLPTVPSNVSAFSNDAGYITLADLPIYDGTVQTGT